jgi:hypothetical protein
MTMKSAHTHRGSCQWCGRLQAVDNKSGLIAKHGYSVADYGFFNGTCTGSGHPPLQVSCEMVKQSIVWAKGDLRRTERYAAELRADTSNVAHVSHYLPIPHDRRGRKGYQLVKTEFSDEPTTLSNGLTYNKVWMSYEHAGKAVREADRSCLSSAAEGAAKYRGYRAKDQDKLASDLGRYIGEQQAVVNGWRPTALVPVKQ